MRWPVLLVVVSLGCAPTIDGPVERQRAIDHADATRLTAQLAALPGVVRAEVVLQRAVRDPLSIAPATAPSSSVVVIVDDGADRARVEDRARTLARATARDIEPTIVVEVGATRAHLAKVGPFTVAAASRGPLKAALAAALGLIALLAGWVAWSYRRGNSAQ